jgi:hypothetical protein
VRGAGCPAITEEVLVLDVPGQITIDDAIDDCERQAALSDHADGGDLERLGETTAYGYLILELLERNGWAVHVRAPFAGAIDGDGTPGVVILAAHRFAEIPDLKFTGRTVADCAPQLMIEAGKYVRVIANARARLGERES